jgi:uncharacterized sulfatase
MSLSKWLLAAACGYAIGAPAATPAAEPTGKKLNVLFIVADDLNCQLGCYGNPVVQTPNIDKLAVRGVRFDRSYCNYPVCNASRTSFLSGRYPDTTGVFGNGTEPRVKLGKDFRFLPEYFRDHGYFTAGVGKIAHGTFAKAVTWDVFAEPQRGVDEDANPANRPRRAQRAAERDRKPGQEPVPFPWQATANKDEEEPDGITARKIVKLLEQHKDGPFFIAAGFHKPHVPHTAPKKYFDLYPLDAITLPEIAPDFQKQVPRPALASTPPWPYFGVSRDHARECKQAYYAAISFVDAQIGRLLDAMDRNKLWDNTVVVFWSDHGYHLGEHGLWMKRSLFEESDRVPLVIVAPGAKGNGKTCARTVEFVDLYPTLADRAGLTPPPGYEGVSLKDLLADPAAAHDRPAFTQVHHPGAVGHAVRTERWRYVEWDQGKQGSQLYDHEADPHELKNLADDPKYAGTVEELKRLVRKNWPADSFSNKVGRRARQ